MTTPSEQSMKAARKVFADCAAAFNHEPLTPDGPDPVLMECVAAALDAYAAERIGEAAVTLNTTWERHVVRIEAERDAALAHVERAKAEANRVARLADSECDRRVAAEERVRVLEAALRRIGDGPLDPEGNFRFADPYAVAAAIARVALDVKAAADELGPNARGEQ